jgi:hypothetical protein
MADNTQGPDITAVDRCIEILGEHFDSVQIFATRHESTTLDGTLSITKGTGNYFARYGQIREWILEQDEATRMATHEDDDGEADD